MKENDLVEIDIQHGEDRLALRRAQPQQAAIGPIMTAMPAGRPDGDAPGPGAGRRTRPGRRQEARSLLEIKSPIVGTFYEAPSPDSDPYVEPGSRVDSQTVVCIIEAMKVMNEIKAEVSGTIVEKTVKNGQAVEYGQVLFRVRPD